MKTDLKLSLVLCIIFSCGLLCAEELPWWDDLPTFVQTSDPVKAKESHATIVLCGSADNPTWGLWQQLERMVDGRNKIETIHANGQKSIVWFEGYGTAQANVVSIERGPDGAFIKNHKDNTINATRYSHWSWQLYDGKGEPRWLGIANYFDEDDFVKPWSRSHPEYGCYPMTYPDGTVATGYVDDSDPRTSRVFDAGCSKDVLGNVTFEYNFNDAVNKIDPTTKKIAGPITGLVQVTTPNLGPPDPGFTPEEWKQLKSAQYAGVISAGKDTACPIWNEYTASALKLALSADVDGLWVDNYSPWDNFNAHPNLKSFGEWSVAKFRPFLAELESSGAIESGTLAKLGITDPAMFDVREYLKEKCREFGGKPENLSDPVWRDARWQDDPIWRAFLVYKRRLGTETFDTFYSTIKRVATEAGKPDFLISGNDIPCFSLGWIRGELDMVSTELSLGWHLTTGPRGIMPPPLGSYVPIAKLAREHAKSRFVNAWFYSPKDQEGKPQIGDVIHYQGLANHLMPMPQMSSHTLGTPETNAAFFAFVAQVRPQLRHRLAYDEEIGIYYSSSSQLLEMMPGGFRDHNNQPHSFAVYGWGTILSGLHRGWRAVPQWKVSAETLAPLKVFVVPNVSAFDRSQLPILRSWVANGGTLVVTGAFAERSDEEKIFERATPLKLTEVADASATWSEKKYQNGRIIYIKNDPGYDFYKLDKERPERLVSLKPIIDKITKGHTFRLDAPSVPYTVGITLYSDDASLFIDVNNTNIDTASDKITPTPPITFDVVLPESLRECKLRVQVLSPTNAPQVVTQTIDVNTLRVTLEPFEVYTCVVVTKE
ncbi:MAG: hypothetical protein ACRC46_06500 [Thermoguttaceae bacterium]